MQQPPEYTWECKKCGKKGTAYSGHPFLCPKCKTFVYPETIICRGPGPSGPEKAY